jgi:hypothetical protein
LAAPGKDKAKELDGPANDLRRKAQLIKLSQFTAKLRHFFKYKSNVAYHQLLGGLLRQSVHGSVSVEVALPARAGRSVAAPLWRYPLRQLINGRRRPWRMWRPGFGGAGARLMLIAGMVCSRSRMRCCMLRTRRLPT